VQIVKSLAQITPKFLNRVFGQDFVLLDELKKVTSCAVFKNNPKVIARFIPVEKFKNVAILKVVENSHFIQYLLASVFFD
jgi:hypothetical protein